MNVHKRLKVLPVIFLMIFLTACYDKAELEDRGFISAISIDKEEDSIVLGAEMLALSENSKEDGSRDVKNKSGSTLSQAMRSLEDHSAKRLSYGLVKACFLGESILSDTGALQGVVDALERNNEISKKLLILTTTGAAGEMLSKELNNELSFGYFMTNYYTNNKGRAPAALRLDLENLSSSLHEGGVLVPAVEYNKDEKSIRPTGAIAVSEKGIAYAGTDELRGYLWARGFGRGTEVVCDFHESKVTLLVNDSSVKLDFCENIDESENESENKLVCMIHVRVEGTLGEYPSYNLESVAKTTGETISELEKSFSKIISDDVLRTFEFLKESGVDALCLNENLRKHHPGLYDIYGNAWPEIDVNIESDVNIRGAYAY